MPAYSMSTGLTGRTWEGQRRGETLTSQNPSLWNPSWLSDGHTASKDPESDQLWAKQEDWPETTRAGTSHALPAPRPGAPSQ